MGSDQASSPILHREVRRWCRYVSEIIDHTSQFPHCFRSRCCRAELPEAEAPAGQTEVPKAHELLERGPRGRVGRKYRISTSSPPRKAGRSNIPPIPRHFPAGNRLYSRLIFQASGCCCVFGKLHAGTKHSSVSALCQRFTTEQIKVSRRIPTNKAFERYFHPDQALVKSVYATAKGVTRSGLIHGRCYIDDKRTTNRRTFLERWERKKRRVGANPRETE